MKSLLLITIFSTPFMIGTALAGGDYFKCETSGGSPWAYDCNNAINEINPNKCYQLNAQSSGCQKIHKHGSCTITVCVDDNFVFNGPEVSGSFLQGQARTLLDKCGCSSNNCKVGGYIHKDNAVGSAEGSARCVTQGLGYVNTEFTHS
jgi:hypothetical protein